MHWQSFHICRRLGSFCVPGRLFLTIILLRTKFQNCISSFLVIRENLTQRRYNPNCEQACNNVRNFQISSCSKVRESCTSAFFFLFVSTSKIFLLYYLTIFHSSIDLTCINYNKRARICCEVQLKMTNSEGRFHFEWFYYEWMNFPHHGKTDFLLLALYSFINAWLNKRHKMCKNNLIANRCGVSGKTKLLVAVWHRRFLRNHIVEWINRLYS